MKRGIILLLVLAMCLSLCACGGMAGEKAAAMYPDIIGQWGTDPFGDEFVLTLEKDGTCIILDNEGTWTLNEKNSNTEWVELSIKTKAMEYHVQLDRVQPDRHYMYYSVNLSIMDSKKQTQIYEDYVFTLGNNFVSPEQALHTVPELIGEWGTPYWNEESILTVREDGTCTMLRQPGKWCLWSDFSTWPKIVILVKPENGQLYEAEFSLDTDNDWGYSNGFLDIYNREEDRFIWIDEEQNYSGARVINRNQVIQPMEVASVVVGEWTKGENKNSFAVFRDDGTCTIRGADGLWTLDYTAYYNEKFRNGWDYCLHAKISGDEYDICFTAPDDYGKCSMYIINQDDGIYILDAGTVYKVNDGE